LNSSTEGVSEEIDAMTVSVIRSRTSSDTNSLGMERFANSIARLILKRSKRLRACRSPLESHGSGRELL